MLSRFIDTCRVDRSSGAINEKEWQRNLFGLNSEVGNALVVGPLTVSSSDVMLLLSNRLIEAIKYQTGLTLTIYEIGHKSC